jgi:hypothetical protein
MKYPMPFFGPKMSYASQTKVWEKHWGFLEKSSFPQEAPIFIGEFGTCSSSARCVSDTTPGSQGLWFSFLTRYLRTHSEIGWSFWALNGTSHKGNPVVNYVLRSDWKSLQLPSLVQTFRDLETPPSPGS